MILKLFILGVLVLFGVLWYFLGIRRASKIYFIALLSGLGLIVLAAILVNLTVVQNFIISRVTANLSEKLHTRVEIHHVDFQLFDQMNIEGALVEDHQRDTLLYAGKLTVRVTDFFFLRSKPILHYIGLDQAVVKLIRKPGDSSWNYQFLIDAFPAAPAKSTSSKNGMDLDLRKMNLQNLRFSMDDGWEGEDMHLVLKGLQLDARSLDLHRNLIQINHITLDEPRFEISNYKPSHPGDTLAYVNSSNAAGAPSKWNIAGWNVFIHDLIIHMGAFALTNNNGPVEEGYFDPGHIRISAISAHLTNTRVVGDSIYSQINLAAQERCGLRIRKLATRFKISPVEIEFADLDLETNRSHIRNYYSMHFTDFGDMGDYLNKVVMHARFLNSEISSDDIAFFAPSLSEWKTPFLLKGIASGTLSNLSADDIYISAGSTTTFAGNIQIIGLPDLNHTYIDFSARQLHTTSGDIVKYVPSLKKFTGVNLNALNDIRFSGNFTGFFRDFVAFGHFQTSLGDVRSDVNMKLGSKGIPSVYSGNITTTDFDLGALLGISLLGKATLDAKIDGQGLNLNHLRANLISNIDQISINGYTYHNIHTNGEFGKKLFNGLVLVNDPNLDLLFRGKIDFSDSMPVFNFAASISHSDLRVLQLTKDSMLFSGQLDMDFAGSNMDNFLGTARLYNINLYKNKQRIAFDSLYVHTSITGKQKTLLLQGNEITGYVKGIYQLHELPEAVLLMLNNYYPSLIPKPAHFVPDENFSFALNLGKVDSLIQVFTHAIYGFNESQITGNLDAPEDKLDINASVPSMGIGKYRFDNISLKGTGSLHKLGLQASIQNIYSGDSLLFPNTSIIVSSNHDTSYLELKTSATSTLNEADITTRIFTSSDGYDISLLNSELVINDKTWKIAPDNDFRITKNAISVHDFNISHDNQRISLSSNDRTAKDTDSTKPSFNVGLQNLNINDFAVLAKMQSRLEGTANGNILVTDPFGNIQVSGQLRATDFRLENDSIGVLTTTAKYDQGTLTLHAASEDLKKSFRVDGSIGLTKDNEKLNLNLDLNALDIGLLNNFLTGYVTNLSGYATGQLAITGTRPAPEMNGTLELDSTGLIVNYLKTYYTFSNAKLSFSDDVINLGNIVLHDPHGNTATLTGKITHDHFSNLNFNCNVTTTKFQFLNTDEDDNILFYGSVYASGNISLNGPLKDLQMVVNVAPQQGTHLYLPLSTGTDVDKHDFIVFKSYGTELKTQRHGRSNTNLTIRLNAAMNNLATIDVILDQATGDEIQATGSGTIKMEFSLNGGLNIFGTYMLDEGNYTFIYQRLLTKKFKISQGSTISWNGNPYNANVNVNAIYTVPGGASLYDLISGDIETSSGFLTDEDKDLAERKEKVDVYLILTGKLMKPDINFDIRLPEAGIDVGSYALARLDQVKQDNSELTQEVAWLLLFNQFYPVTPSATNSNLIRSGGLTSVGQFLSSTASTQLNGLLGKVIKDKTVGFNMDYDAYSASGETGDPLERNEVRVGITKSLLNNRIKLEAGPSVDWGRTSYVNNQYTNSSAFAGDFQVEYLITSDGRVRTTVFRRSNYDVLLNGTLSEFGATLTYKREFDNFAELFGGRKLREQQDSLQKAQQEELNRKIIGNILSPPDPTVKK